MKTAAARIVPSHSHSVNPAKNVRGACSITLLLALLGGASLAIGAVSSHWSAVGLGLVTICLFMLIGTGIVPHALALGLQRSYPATQPAHAAFGPSVCIVLLGEGSTFDPRTNQHMPSWIAGSRIVMTAALQRAALASGAKSRIIIAGDRTRTDQLASSSSYARTLVDLGVSDSDVMQENEGMNTYEHARNISEMVKSFPVETVCLVTSALHMKRALLYFGAFGLRPDPFPSDYIYVPRNLLPIGYNFAVADIALHQYIGIFRFYVYEKLGLNRRFLPLKRD